MKGHDSLSVFRPKRMYLNQNQRYKIKSYANMENAREESQVWAHLKQLVTIPFV